MTDNLKRKRSPTGLEGNFKHLKKTASDKRGRSELIEINSDNSQSDNDSLGDAFSDSSSDDSEYSDNEAQMTDDERHLPRPQKRRTNRELQVTGSNIDVSTDELEEELGEDEAGMLKNGTLPAHIHVGSTDCIINNGREPNHNVSTKTSVKQRIVLQEGKSKKEVPVETFKLMIQYAFRTVGLDSANYPVVFSMAVKYISSTNFFQANMLSSWGAQKRITTEADLLRATSARYPHYVLTMAPDLILCLIAAIYLRSEVYGGATGRAITIIGEFHVFSHLRSAIELGETVSWDKGSRGQLLILGRRGEHDPLPADLPVLKSSKGQTKKCKKIPQAVPVPHPANVINIEQESIDFMQPYPFRPTLQSTPITKVITAEEWDRRNAHWLDKLMDPESTKDDLGPTIEEEVTEEIFPLISKARRNVLYRWAKSEDFDLDLRLLKAPILSQVEVRDNTNRGILDVETDSIRRSIRAIETAALSLPKAYQKTAALIKQHTDRLFACRDQEMDNQALVAQSAAKRRESLSATMAEITD